VNLLCICFEISTISKASLHTETLAVVNAIAVFADSNLAFLAFQLDILLRTTQQLHQSVRIMIFLLILFYVLVVTAFKTHFSLNVSEICLT